MELLEASLTNPINALSIKPLIISFTTSKSTKRFLWLRIIQKDNKGLRKKVSFMIKHDTT